MPVRFDNSFDQSVFPFAEIYPAEEIIVGILSIREKWELLFQNAQSSPIAFQEFKIPSTLIPDYKLAKSFIQSQNTAGYGSIGKFMEFPWSISLLNDWALRQDFEIMTRGRKSEPVPEGVQAINPANIFIEPGAELTHCILNASTGPIYISGTSVIMEGATIRGPFALREHAVVKMGARIYGATTVGPYCTVGGEIKNSVLLGYSNKGHDGYLGDSVLGCWCNLGAGTSNSNLKNNVSEVKVWNEKSQAFEGAGMKCGLLMGDFSRSAINTSFNTGTLVGTCSNVFGAGLTPKYIPGFSWGYSRECVYEFEKALQDIRNWKKLKHQELNEEEIKKLKNTFARLEKNGV